MLTASNAGGSKAPLIESGLHEAVCYAIVDLGTVHSDMFNNDSRKIVLIWEIPDSRIDTDKGNLPRAISKRYTMSLNAKANLRRDLVSWRSREFTPEEEEAFDLRKVLGSSCILNIIHDEKRDGGRYAAIANVLPLKGKKLKPENKLVVYGIEEHGLDIPDALPPWLVDEIKKAPEYQSLLHPDDAPQADFTPDDLEPGEELALDDIPF